jgi:hypothetical protein
MINSRGEKTEGPDFINLRICNRSEGMDSDYVRSALHKKTSALPRGRATSAQRSSAALFIH